MICVACIFIKVHWEHFCELLSIFCEVFGVFRMARRYTRFVGPFQMARILLSALTRSAIAHGAARFGERNKDDALDALQGLAFIALGFALRAVPHLTALIKPEWLS